MVKRKVLPPLLLLFAPALRAAPDPTILTIWPGYTVGLPAGHCVQVSRGPDFTVLYFRDERAPKSPILVGVYTGHNPRDPECAKSTARQWTANGLSFKSVRNAEGCAEFAVEDLKKPERGSLHMWFGPGAKDHSDLAEGVVASVHPAPLPIEHPSELPACK